MTGPPVVVIGGGGHAKVVIQTLQAAGRAVEAILDDELPAGQLVMGVPIAGKICLAPQYGHCEAVIGIGDNATRRRLATACGLRWTVALHPAAIVAPDVLIGDGAVVFAGAVIQPGAEIGKHVIINTGATVDHDCVLGDFVHIAPGVHLGGAVKVAEGAFVGIGAVVLPDLSLGDWSTLGGGAVAVRNVAPNTVSVGVPSRYLDLDHPQKTATGQRNAPVRGTFIGPADPRWRSVLDRARHDFYHLPQYAELCGAQEDATPVAFYAEDGDLFCLIPFLVRRPPTALDPPRGWSDLISPYGYPSPLFPPSLDLARKTTYLQALTETAREIGAVSILIRTHPLLSAVLSVGLPLSNVLEQGDTIAVDLLESESAIWSHTRDGHRSDIRRLEKLRYTPIMDNWALYGDFMRMYRETMARLGVGGYYLFSDEYFRGLKAALGDALHLCCVLEPGGRPVCGGLFVRTGNIVQYHLSGSDEAYQRFAPTKLMLHFVRLWAKRQGVSTLHLGGGASSQQDSLLAFKAGFSPLRCKFRTIRIIVDEQRYAALVLRAGKRLCPQDDLTGGYFPAYRRI